MATGTLKLTMKPPRFLYLRVLGMTFYLLALELLGRDADAAQKVFVDRLSKKFTVHHGSRKKQA